MRLKRIAAGLTTTVLLAVAATIPVCAAQISGKVQVFTSLEAVDERNKYQDSVLKGFEKLHPGVKVETIRVPWPQYTKFQSLLVSGAVPDMWLSAGMYASNQYVEQGVWKDLTPLINRDKFDLSQYFQPTLEASTFQGKRYGLPIAMFTDALIYNVELFNQAGLPEPPHDYNDTSWTWDKFIEYGKKLTKDTNGDGIPEIWGIDGIGHLDTVAASFGSFPFSSDFRKAQYDSPGVVKAYELARDIQFRYHISPTYQERLALNLGGVAFDRGVAGMLIDFTTRAGNYINRKDLKFDLAAKPRGPAGPKVLLYLNTINMINGGPNPEAAWELIKYLSRPDVLPGMAVYGYNAIPPTKDGALLFVEQFKKQRPDVDWLVFIKGAPYAIPVEYWRPNYGEVYNTVKEIGGQILNNEKDVRNGLNELNEKIQAILDKYWASKAGK
ncbi:MAG: extracellular solute-binding protein [Limnochordales bacterium]|nr:extracellular solute-binding protein [Limnochordales bacterium]